ncbi:hypothetical protein BgiMline_036407, partial [Biomphalaria glabrata]
MSWKKLKRGRLTEINRENKQCQGRQIVANSTIQLCAKRAKRLDSTERKNRLALRRTLWTVNTLFRSSELTNSLVVKIASLCLELVTIAVHLVDRGTLAPPFALFVYYSSGPYLAAISCPAHRCPVNESCPSRTECVLFKFDRTSSGVVARAGELSWTYEGKMKTNDAGSSICV